MSTSSQSGGGFVERLRDGIGGGVLNGSGVIGTGISAIVVLAIIFLLVVGIVFVFNDAVTALYATRLKQELVALTSARSMLFLSCGFVVAGSFIGSAFWGAPKIYSILNGMWSRGGKLSDDWQRLGITVCLMLLPTMPPLLLGFMVIGLANAMNDGYSFLKVSGKGDTFEVQQTPQAIDAALRPAAAVVKK